MISILQWKDLWNWLPSESGVGAFAAGTTPAPMGDFLQRVVSPIDKAKRPLESLNVVAKISFGGVLHVRTDEEKAGYKGPLFEAKPGYLVFSKIRVGQGSLCVVPDDLDHLAVSPEYPVYRADNRLIRPRFLNLLLRSAQFQKLLRSQASGNTTKKRIRPEDFELLEVPLPVLEEQDEILRRYDAELERAGGIEGEANVKEREALRNFEAELGLAPLPDLPRRLLQIARFSDMDRWSHEGILQHVLLSASEPQAAFDFVLLEDFAKVSYGLQKSPANRPGKNARPYLRVANVRRGELNLRDIKFIEVPDRDMPKFRLEDGDILFVEGNGTLSELGHAAIWRGEIEDCVHQNHIIKARLDERRADPEFVMEWFNTDAGRQHFFRNAKTTSGLGTLNSNDIRTAPVPLPPSLDEQRRIVWTLRETRRVAGEYRAMAGKVRTAAWGEFLSAVFE